MKTRVPIYIPSTTAEAIALAISSFKINKPLRWNDILPEAGIGYLGELYIIRELPGTARFQNALNNVLRAYHLKLPEEVGVFDDKFAAKLKKMEGSKKLEELRAHFKKHKIQICLNETQRVPKPEPVNPTIIFLQENLPEHLKGHLSSEFLAAIAADKDFMQKIRALLIERIANGAPPRNSLPKSSLVRSDQNFSPPDAPPDPR